MRRASVLAVSVQHRHAEHGVDSRRNRRRKRPDWRPNLAASRLLISVSGRRFSDQACGLEHARGIAEVLHRHAHAIHERQVEDRHRRFLAVDHAALGFSIAAAADEQRRQVFVQVAVAIERPAP